MSMLGVAQGLITSTLLFFLGIAFLVSPVFSYQELTDETLKSLPRPGNDFDIHNGAILAPILRTRVPGTEGSVAVLEHFMKFFRENLPDWNIELQNSTSQTPATGDKEVPFVNLIASRDPPGTTIGDVGRLTLVAHYDSKLTPTGFIGATDSAAPCAMILHAIRSIDAALTHKWEGMKDDGSYNSFFDEHKGIQIFLLDGEEAFKHWTSTDSLYGARSLAQNLEDEVYPAMSTYKSPLSAISLFVLLDLLGNKKPRMPSYFQTTHWAYKKMGRLENRLRELGQFKSSPNHPSKRSAGRATEDLWFIDALKHDPAASFGGIQDDHIPFMQRGVDILHLIPSPFPKVWHTIHDDAEHLDPDTVEDWSILTTAFVAEWLDLEDALSKNEKRASGKSEFK